MIETKDDLTGKRFGRLIVLCQAEDYVSPQGKHYAQWLCECNCSNSKQIVVRGYMLTSGRTKSCGCLRKENVIKKNQNQHKKYNEYDLSGEFGIGWTSNTNEEFWFELEDYDKIKHICWEGVIQNGMRVLTGYDPQTKKQVKMHNALGYSMCDHVDRNEFNNLKRNLRQATYSENAMNRTIRNDNSSGIIGVKWHKKNQKWCADICKESKRIFLGSFNNKNDAIKARLKAEYKLFKDFAPQRHLFEKYNIVEDDVNEQK